MNIDQQISVLQTQLNSLSTSLAVVQAGMSHLQQQYEVEKEALARAIADEQSGRLFAAGIGAGAQSDRREGAVWKMNIGVTPEGLFYCAGITSALVGAVPRDR
jgi:hypothetical protein